MSAAYEAEVGEEGVLDGRTARGRGRRGEMNEGSSRRFLAFEKFQMATLYARPR